MKCYNRFSTAGISLNLASEFVAVGAAGKHFICRLSRVAFDIDMLDKAAGALSGPRFCPRPRFVSLSQDGSSV
jgi:hypothetical protein